MPDGIYLVNCTRASDGDRISAVAFYQDLELEATTPGQSFGGNTGQPDAFRYIGDHGSFVTWEGPGNPRSATFNTGVTFTWTIEPGAENAGVKIGDVVGGGQNGFQNFDVHKDNQEQLCVNGDGYSCEKVYFCTPK